MYIYIIHYIYIRLAAAVAASARAARSPDPRNAVVSVGGHRRVSAVPTIHGHGAAFTKLTAHSTVPGNAY